MDHKQAQTNEQTNNQNKEARKVSYQVSLLDENPKRKKTNKEKRKKKKHIKKQESFLLSENLENAKTQGAPGRTVRQPMAKIMPGVVNNHSRKRTGSNRCPPVVL